MAKINFKKIFNSLKLILTAQLFIQKTFKMFFK